MTVIREYRWAWVTLALLPVAALVLAAGVEDTAKDTVKGQGDADAPRRALVLIPKIVQTDEPDNSFCIVCHDDFKKEKLVRIHVKEGVGCEQCHGPSFDHSEDEDHVTPPDIMFKRGMVNMTCIQCHDLDELKEEDDDGDHELVLKDPATTVDVCTDCHGKHHMKLRSRRWDKISRELVYSGEAVPAKRDDKPAAKSGCDKKKKAKDDD